MLAWPTSRNVRADERVVRIVVLGDSLTAGWWATSGNVKLLLPPWQSRGTSRSGLGEAELRSLTNGLPLPDQGALERNSRATADEDGRYVFAIPL